AMLAACEFVPAPPPAPAPAAPPRVPQDAPPNTVAVAAVADGGEAPRPDAALIAVTDECVRTSTHIADVLIAGAPDPSLKASYEAARDRIVRATAEACTTQAWSDAEQRCFAQAKVEADLRACEKKFPPPPEPPKHQL
ncbi:MAG TPA: hypothetical protein VIV58_24015, partial [Kofleriaceae bacterium]